MAYALVKSLAVIGQKLTSLFQMSLQVTCVKVTANKMNKEILKRSAMIDFLLPAWLIQTPELKRKKF